MNSYTMHFAGICPTNGARNSYTLRIDSESVISVEELVAHIEAVESGEPAFHEDIADGLAARFAGKHTLTAMHHGVLIETQRSTLVMGEAIENAHSAPCEAAKPVVSSRSNENEQTTRGGSIAQAQGDGNERS